MPLNTGFFEATASPGSRAVVPSANDNDHSRSEGALSLFVYLTGDSV
jgi:hypothetical protein